MNPPLLTGTELQSEVNSAPHLAECAEQLRVVGAAAMGLVATPGSPTSKIAFVARRADCTAADGLPVNAADIDVLARIFSMAKLHHATTVVFASAIRQGL